MFFLQKRLTIIHSICFQGLRADAVTTVQICIPEANNLCNFDQISGNALKGLTRCSCSQLQPAAGVDGCCFTFSVQANPDRKVLTDLRFQCGGSIQSRQPVEDCPAVFLSLRPRPLLQYQRVVPLISFRVLTDEEKVTAVHVIEPFKEE